MWQGRFYSCPLDDAHLWTALRYVELNPVRAGMVETASQWRWSSAATHCGLGSTEIRLDLEAWQKRWTITEWIGYLAEEESSAELAALRRFTHTGRPLGNAAFVAQLEQSTLPCSRRTEEVVARNLLPLTNNTRLRSSPRQNWGQFRLSPICPPICLSPICPCAHLWRLPEHISSF